MCRLPIENGPGLVWANTVLGAVPMVCGWLHSSVCACFLAQFGLQCTVSGRWALGVPTWTAGMTAKLMESIWGKYWLKGPLHELSDRQELPCCPALVYRAQGTYLFYNRDYSLLRTSSAPWHLVTLIACLCGVEKLDSLRSVFQFDKENTLCNQYINPHVCHCGFHTA